MNPTGSICSSLDCLLSQPSLQTLNSRCRVAMSVLLVVRTQLMGRRHLSVIIRHFFPTQPLPPQKKNLSDVFSIEYQDQRNLAVCLFLCMKAGTYYTYITKNKKILMTSITYLV